MRDGSNRGQSKRSGRVGLTRMSQRVGALAGASVLLASCGAETAPPVVEPEEKGPKIEVQAFENVFECVSVTGMSQDECAAARTEAVALAATTAPRFEAAYDCEAEWGQGNCMPQNSNGSSFFTPFVVGFLLGKVMNGGKRDYLPLFRKGKDSPMQTANGVRLGYNGGPGKYVSASRAFEQAKAVPKLFSASSAASQAGLTRTQDQFASSDGSSTRVSVVKVGG